MAITEVAEQAEDILLHMRFFVDSDPEVTWSPAIAKSQDGASQNDKLES